MPNLTNTSGGSPLITKPLPAALQALLPDIAADQGRHRARSLLGLLAVDLDYADGRLADLHLALGLKSPGVDELRALVQAARTATSAAATVVPKQHVISQVVLKRWTEPVPGKPTAGHQLMRHDLARGTTKAATSNQVGYVMDFVKVDSGTVEQVWQRVENRLPDAIAAAEDGSILHRPELQQVLREALALHFARNPHTLEAHVASWKAVRSRQIQAIAATPLASEAFRRAHSGIVPAGPEAQLLGAEAALVRLTEAEHSGALFRLIVEDRFDRVCDLLGQTPLEILTPIEPDDEFVIGDVPAITYDAKMDAVGVREGVALMSGDTVMLPLGPRLLIALGPNPQLAALGRPAVERMNQLQVRAAQSYVCYRPGAAVARQIAVWRPPGPSL
jgi:hypothetical protein